MRKWRVVLFNQWSISNKDKGMNLFQMALIFIIGLIPLLVKNLTLQIELLAVFPLFSLKQLTAESIALEKENKTIEPLISTSLKKEELILGKAAFSLFRASIYFIVIFIIQYITRMISNQNLEPSVLNWIIFVIVYLNVITLLSLAGVYLSAVSENMRTAQSKISLCIYPAMFMILILITLVASDVQSFMVMSLLIFLISVISEAVVILKVKKMKHSDFIKTKI